MADSARRGATAALGIAWAMGWPIVAGVALGYWLDETLGTSPWLTLVFALAALAGVVRRLIHASTLASDNSRRDDP